MVIRRRLLIINLTADYKVTTHTSPHKVLLLKIVEGDELAFRQFFDTYSKKIHSCIFNVTRSSEIAEEITADIFVKLWTGRKMLADIQDPGAFLRKMAYFRALDFLKTISRHKKLQEQYNNWYLRNIAEKTPDDLLIYAELVRCYKEAVAKLPPQRKLIYQLSRDEGLTHDEIAHLLSLSRNTVKNSIVTATRFLADYVRGRSYDPILLIILFNFFF